MDNIQGNGIPIDSSGNDLRTGSPMNNASTAKNVNTTPPVDINPSANVTGYEIMVNGKRISGNDKNLSGQIGYAYTNRERAKSMGILKESDGKTFIYDPWGAKGYVEMTGVTTEGRAPDKPITNNSSTVSDTLVGDGDTKTFKSPENIIREMLSPMDMSQHGLGDQMNDVMRRQYETILDTAKRVARRRMDNLSPSESANQSFVDTVTPTTQPYKKQPKEQDNQSPIGGQVAQSAGVTMRSVGGQSIPSYMRGNTQIDLPSGIDLNDDVAVRDAMANYDTILDMMDNIGNNQEEFV